MRSSHTARRVRPGRAGAGRTRTLEKILSDLGSPLRVAEPIRSAGPSTTPCDGPARSGRARDRADRGVDGQRVSLRDRVLRRILDRRRLPSDSGGETDLAGHVGLIVVDGFPRSFGIALNVPPGAVVYGGYAVIPIALVWGLVSSSSRIVPPGGSWRGGATVSRHFSPWSDAPARAQQFTTPTFRGGPASMLDTSRFDVWTTRTASSRFRRTSSTSCCAHRP